jgi:hypothetical protein
MLKILALATVFAASSAASPLEVPVTIGGEPEVAACTVLSEVTGTNSTAMRTGPGNDYPETMRLRLGDLVHVCSTSPGDEWIGVVLAQDGIIDCGVSSAVPVARPYPGPCISGWVLGTALRRVSG